MTLPEYIALGNREEPWYCTGCSETFSNPFAFTDSFFNESSSSLDSDRNMSDISKSEESDSNTADIMCEQLQEIKSKLGNSALLAYLNINSYRYKSSDIISVLNNNTVSIMCIAETKLDQSFPDQQFQAENYTMHRRDGPSQFSVGLIV